MTTKKLSTSSDTPVILPDLSAMLAKSMPTGFNETKRAVVGTLWQAAYKKDVTLLCVDLVPMVKFTRMNTQLILGLYVDLHMQPLSTPDSKVGCYKMFVSGITYESPGQWMAARLSTDLTDTIQIHVKKCEWLTDQTKFNKMIQLLFGSLSQVL